MSNRVDAFQDRIGYRFRDADLLETALTHASHGDGTRRSQSNERLEFLGDRVLGLMAAQTLYAEYSSVDEGGLAHRLNEIVNKTACAQVARDCGLGEALRLSVAEERLGGREKPSILGDACEAIIGALYLDGGLEAAQSFFKRYWSKSIEALSARPKDAKSELQEWAAKTGRSAPDYETVGRSGPDHRPMFKVRVAVSGLEPAEGEGSSKQEAQRAAAAAMLEREGAHER